MKRRKIGSIEYVLQVLGLFNLKIRVGIRWSK